MKSAFSLIAIAIIMTAFGFNTYNWCLADTRKIIPPSSAESLQQIYGPYGGQIIRIVADTKRQLFVGTRDGVFCSSDDGEHWINTELPLNNHMVVDISFSPKGEIFAAARDYAFVSTDNGATWKQNKELLPLDLSRRVFTPSGRSLIFDVYPKGIYRSDDGMTGWRPINTGLPSLYIHALIVSPKGHLLAGTQSGLFVSTNDGDSWQRVDMCSPMEDIEVWDIVGTSSGLLYALLKSGIYSSTDGEYTWKRIHDNAINTRGRISVSPTGQIFLATSDGIYRYSMDKKEPYLKTIIVGSEDARYNSIFIAPNGHLFATNSLSGIFRSVDNGDTWNRVNNGLTGDPVSSLVVAPSGNIYACASTNIYGSSNNGKNWVATSPHLPQYPKCLALSYNRRLIIGKSNGVFYSDDGGKKWIRSAGLSDSIISLAVSSKECIFAASYSDVYRSTDNGENWVRLGNEKEAGGGFLNLGKNRIRSITVGPDGSVFVPSGGSDIYRSTDGGGSWLHLGALPPGMPIECMFIEPKGTILVGSMNNLCISSDNGAHWTINSITPLSISANMNTILVHEGTTFVGTTYGICYSKDNEHWIKMEGVPSNDDVISLAVSPDKHLLVGTCTHGVLRFPMPGSIKTE